MTSGYVRPLDIDEALGALARGPRTVLAGGTDFYPARVGRAVTEPVLDIGGLAGLRKLGIVEGPGNQRWLEIGAMTTWSDIVRGELPPAARALQECGREVGGVQIQNLATVAGNLCNASPAADGVPVLMALDAQVRLRSVSGTRDVPVVSFVQGNRRTLRRPDELVTAILIPLRSPRQLSGFFKLGHRRYLVIAITMVAVALDFDDHDRLASCGIAVGACSAAARRLSALEAGLITTPRHALAARLQQLFAQGTDAVAGLLAGLSPIDDVRGSASYRLEVVPALVQRVLLAVAHPDKAGTA